MEEFGADTKFWSFFYRYINKNAIEKVLTNFDNQFLFRWRKFHTFSGCCASPLYIRECKSKRRVINGVKRRCNGTIWWIQSFVAWTLDRCATKTSFARRRSNSNQISNRILSKTYIGRFCINKALVIHRAVSVLFVSAADEIWCWSAKNSRWLAIARPVQMTLITFNAHFVR